MKRTLLASSALVVLFGAPHAQAQGFYVSVFGGANWADDSSGSTAGSTGFSAEPDGGFAIGGAVGVKLDAWLPGLRSELEISYRRNDVGGSWFADDGIDTGAGVIDANISTFAVMANAYYDIDFGGKLRPYVAAGVGWARSHVDGVFVTEFPDPGTRDPFEAENAGFAWQVGAGFNYEVADGVEVGIGYRYFRGPRIDDPVFLGKNDLPVNFEPDNHTVAITLTVDTN